MEKEKSKSPKDITPSESQGQLHDTEGSPVNRSKDRKRVLPSINKHKIRNLSAKRGRIFNFPLKKGAPSEKHK